MPLSSHSLTLVLETPAIQSSCAEEWLRCSVASNADPAKARCNSFAGDRSQEPVEETAAFQIVAFEPHHLACRTDLGAL